MEKPLEPGALCSTCHAPLKSDGSCPACMLRGGLLDETVIEEPPVLAATAYGDFEIARREDGSLWELGRGAMGVTYKAIDRVLHRPVALKVIQLGAGAGQDPQVGEALRERFLREARAAAALRHANVAGVFQFGASDASGRCYYAMELVEGETLEARVRRDGPLDVDTALEVVRQVAAALVAAASRGLIHRDLKPGNLVLAAGAAGSSPDGLEVKVIDFGLAKAAAVLGENDLTHGGFVGTPAFASPEQFARQTLDARSDLYSLGVTLWYALTGKAPFTGRTLEEVSHHPGRQHLPVGQLTARGVAPCVVALLRHMLALDPAERPASARELLEAVEACRRQLIPASAPSAPRSRRLIVVACILISAAAAVGWWAYAQSTRDHRAGIDPKVISVPAVPAVPDKSIAVLPFENLSDDKANGYFTDGVQDEILTDLAKVADLKVISRTSVMRYRGNAARNLREIAAELGVAHVVEGSVQRSGNEVRVNAQLIDARTDAHEWAANYDKTLDNVFTIQTEVAQAIAEQLRAHISPEEHVAMTQVPTMDALALQLYQQAKELEAREADSGARDDLLQAVSLLEQATKRDPGFLSAYCWLSRIHLILYWEGFDHTDARRDAGRDALAQAVRVAPDAGETHVAQAIFAYLGSRDYDRALAELDLAQRRLPNNADVAFMRALIYRRQARWDESIREFEVAAARDPRNFQILQETAFTYANLRRYTDASRYYQRALAVIPGDTYTREAFALLAFEERADLGPLRALHASIVAANKPAELESSSYFRLMVALAERDPAGAHAALTTFPSAGNSDNGNVFMPPEWYAGQVAFVFGDPVGAREKFAIARGIMEKQVQAHPDYAQALSALGCIDAMLDHKDEALAEGRHAVEMLPVSKDAWQGPDVASNLAAIYARTGETDLALQELERLVHSKGTNFLERSYGGLKLDPCWDPLRGAPRFEALVASLAPKP